MRRSSAWSIEDRTAPASGRRVMGGGRLDTRVCPSLVLVNGSQPLTSPDGAVHMVVNGEFYGYREIRERLRADGYRFSTDSDSEIAM
jgi:asparagine synthetase B (glutamine-hydrolysing)